MAIDLDQLQYKSADWRGVVAKNKRKTWLVIFSFLLLYIVVGFILDIIFSVDGVEAATGTTSAGIGTAMYQLITFQHIPIVTLITLSISVIWLLCTFAFYDKIMLSGVKYKEVTSDDNDPTAKKLYNVVEEMKIAANMNYMPKVFLMEADYMNAFASGYSEKSAMVAITRPLIEKLNRDELQAVMAHELTHIRNQDIKLNLFTVVLSNMLAFMVDIAYYALLSKPDGGSKGSKGGGKAQVILLVIIIVLRIIMPILTALLMLYLSRTREYMADAGAVELMRNNGPLASALIKISENHQSDKVVEQYTDHKHENLRRASYIFEPAKFSNKKEGSDLFSTHPSLRKRLKAIGITSK